MGRTALTLVVCLVLVAGCAHADSPSREAKRSGSDSGTSEQITPDPATASQDRVRYDGRDCHQSKTDPAPISCEFGDPDGAIHLAVVGDSKTAQYLAALDETGQDRGWRITGFTKSACAFSAATTSDGTDKRNDSCQEWNQRVVSEIVDLDPDAVFNALYKMKVPKLGRQIGAAQQHQLMVEGVHDAFALLNEAGIGVVALDATPRSTENIAECVAEYLDPAECDLPLDEAFDPAEVWSDASRSRLLEGLRATHLISINDQICDDQKCQVVADGTLRFRDAHHLTKTFTLQIRDVLGDRIAASLKD